MPHRTRMQMESIINSGASVMIGGRPVTSIDELPTEARIAKNSGDAAYKRATLEAIRAQKAALDAQEAELDEPAPSLAASPVDDPSKAKGVPAQAPAAKVK